MWVLMAAVTEHWRNLTVFHSTLYHRAWCWIPAAALFGAGLVLYKLSGSGFSTAQLGGLPELLPGHRQQRLVTTGIRGQRPPSRLSGASLRNAGLEHRHWARGLLGADGIRDRHRSSNDQNGRQRTGEPFRRGIPSVSNEGTRGSAEDNAIIRLS